jgi:hypothetical protein
MKKHLFFILSLYFLFYFSGSLFAIAEKTIFLGGPSSWDSVPVRSGICEAPRIRPFPALVLSAAYHGDGTVPAADLELSFDEGRPGLFRDASGHYRISVSPELEAVDRQWARTGNGAALFSGDSALPNTEPLLIEINSSDALFVPGSRFNDFSLEFWLYPFQLENGEQILTWTSSLPQAGPAQFLQQYIRCVAEKNRLKWSFINFFTSPDHTAYINAELTGTTPVVPKTWSHHIIRFDSTTGMIEYTANGEVQAVAYATVSGHEAGEVYTPITGQHGTFNLGSRFTGLMDEFRIYRTFIDLPSLQKFSRPGRMETRIIDLGTTNSGIYKIDARGGRTSLQAAKESIEFQENGRFRFGDDSEMQFFIRTAENPYWWDNSPWVVFTPGTPISEVRGRYMQVAVDFYPSADGECSPYLEELRIRYHPNEAPAPPTSLTAVASDGGVQLRWKTSPDMETNGYFVYYGTKTGDYFGEGAILGVSPIDAGKQNSLFIDGLKNGVLYYFTVAAYKAGNSRDAAQPHIGEFSREVTARPLEGLRRE